MHVNVLSSDRLVTLPFVNVQSDHFVSVIYSTKLFVWYFMVKTEPGESMEWKLLQGLYYYLRNFCHSIGWEQRYFSEIPTCENYSYHGHPKSPNNLVARVTQKWRKDFEILKSVDSRTKRKFWKPKYWEKYIDLAQCLDQLGRKQELQNQFARRRSESTRQK